MAIIGNIPYFQTNPSKHSMIGSTGSLVNGSWRAASRRKPGRNAGRAHLGRNEAMAAMLPFDGVGDGYFLWGYDDIIEYTVMGIIWIYNMMIFYGDIVEYNGNYMDFKHDDLGMAIFKRGLTYLCSNHQRCVWKSWKMLEIMMGRNHLFGYPEKYGIFLETDLETPERPVVLLGEAAFVQTKTLARIFGFSTQSPWIYDRFFVCQCVFSKRSCRRWEWDGTFLFFRRCMTRPLWSNVVNSANFATR